MGPDGWEGRNPVSQAQVCPFRRRAPSTTAVDIVVLATTVRATVVLATTVRATVVLATTVRATVLLAIVVLVTAVRVTVVLAIVVLVTAARVTVVLAIVVLATAVRVTAVRVTCARDRRAPYTHACHGRCRAQYVVPAPWTARWLSAVSTTRRRRS